MYIAAKTQIMEDLRVERATRRYVKDMGRLGTIEDLYSPKRKWIC